MRDDGADAGTAIGADVSVHMPWCITGAGPRLLLRYRRAQLRADGHSRHPDPAIDRVALPGSHGRTAAGDLGHLPPTGHRRGQRTLRGRGLRLCLASDIRICSDVGDVRQRRDSAGVVRRRDGMSLPPAPHRRDERGRRLDDDGSDGIRGRSRPSRSGQRARRTRPTGETRSRNWPPGPAELAPLGVQLTKRAQGEHRRASPAAAMELREPQPGAGACHRRGRGTTSTPMTAEGR